MQKLLWYMASTKKPEPRPKHFHYSTYSRGLSHCNTTSIYSIPFITWGVTGNILLQQTFFIIPSETLLPQIRLKRTKKIILLWSFEGFRTCDRSSCHSCTSERACEETVQWCHRADAAPGEVLTLNNDQTHMRSAYVHTVNIRTLKLGIWWSRKIFAFVECEY